MQSLFDSCPRDNGIDDRVERRDNCCKFGEIRSFLLEELRFSVTRRARRKDRPSSKCSMFVPVKLPRPVTRTNAFVCRSAMVKRRSMVGGRRALLLRLPSLVLACMLSPSLNELVKEKRLAQNTIVKLESVVHHLTSTGKWDRVQSLARSTSCHSRAFLSILDLTIIPQSSSPASKTATNICPIGMITPYINGLSVLSLSFSWLLDAVVADGRFGLDASPRVPFVLIRCVISISSIPVGRSASSPSVTSALASIRWSNWTK